MAKISKIQLFRKNMGEEQKKRVFKNFWKNKDNLAKSQLTL
jgi:hypothetical protein